MGELVAVVYSPEEKAAVAAFLEQRRPRCLASLSSSSSSRSPSAPSFRPGRPVENRVDARQSRAVEPAPDATRELQTSRLRFADLARELERYADASGAEIEGARVRAAEAYRKAAIRPRAARAREVPARELPGDRYFQLLLDRDPQRLIRVRGRQDQEQRGSRSRRELRRQPRERRAGAGGRARARRRPAAGWTSVNMAVAGLHFSRSTRSRPTRSRPRARPHRGRSVETADPALQLTGNNWFSYASRFGEF